MKSETEEQEIEAQIEKLLDEDQHGEAVELLVDLHPAEAVVVLGGLSHEARRELFGRLPDDFAGRVLSEAGPELRGDLLEHVEVADLARFLERLPLDDAVFLLEDLSPAEVEDVLGAMAPARATEVADLLRYKEGTAGRLMTERFASVRATTTAQEAVDYIRQLGREVEFFYHLYAADDEGRLVGVISLRQLLLAQPDQRIADLMNRDVISVKVDDDQELVADTIARYDFLAVPVVNRFGKLVGVITVDDVIDVLEEEANEDILRFGGTFEDADHPSSAGNLAKLRLPWLIVAIVGQMATASVIVGFQFTLERIIALAFFIPVIMATAGNAGIQSLASMVRSIALDNVRAADIAGVLLREARVGVLLGLASGLFAGLITAIWRLSPLLGVIVGVSMAVTIVLAALMGTLIPLVFRMIGKDPAYASGPFITTLNDVLSLLIYFLLANALIEHL